MTDFLILAFIFLTAGVIAVPIAARFGLGSVLGYILAGMAISPLLKWLGVDIEETQHFAEFGVVMMLFLIGLELEPKRLWEMRHKLLGLGGAQVVITVLVIAAIGLATGDEWRIALTVGMILALSSTAIVLQTLQEKGMMKSEGGEASFSVLLMQDIAVIPMLALIPLLAVPELAGAAGAATGYEAHSGINLVEHLPAWQAAIVTIGAIFAILLIGAYLVRPIFRFIASANLRELFTAVALFFVVGIALLMSMVGLSPALGTFIAGVVLANSEYRHELESDIAPFKGLLLGLFFITVGAGVNFDLVASSFGTVAFWTAVLVITKIAVLYAIGTAAKLKGQAKWLFALALAQAGEFGFVLVSIALGSSVITRALGDQLLLIIALSMLITPLLFILYEKAIRPRYVRAETPEPDEIDEQNKIILAGRGRVGGIVERMLIAAGHEATVIDYSSRQLEIVRKFGYKSYFGDATRPDLLHSAGIADAKLLIVALDEKEQINKLVEYAVKNYPDLHVLARAIDRDHVYKLWSMGCRDIIRETYDSSIRMGRSAYEALGYNGQQSAGMANAFEEMDRSSMVEIADVYKVDVNSWENEELIERVKDFKKKWDPMLSEQMDEIIKRGR